MRKQRNWRLASAILVAGVLLAGCGPGPSRSGGQLTGAGATFPAPLYTKWFEEYRRLTGIQINYQSIGSGGGIKALTDNTTDFSASDAPLTDEQIAAAIGVPIGLGTAIYLSEFGGRFATGVRLVVDLLAGLPSIVVGVFVWACLVRHVVGHYSGLAGGVSLALIVIPIVTRTAEEMLKLVPGSLREASYALGVPVWKTILLIVVPAARGGIVTGVMLSLARAGGETAPLLLTALGNQFFSANLLQPMAALPLQIYAYAVSPYEDWHTKAWGSSLVLIAVIAGLSLATRLAARRRSS